MIEFGLFLLCSSGSITQLLNHPYFNTDSDEDFYQDLQPVLPTQYELYLKNVISWYGSRINKGPLVIVNNYFAHRDLVPVSPVGHAFLESEVTEQRLYQHRFTSINAPSHVTSNWMKILIKRQVSCYQIPI